MSAPAKPIKVLIVDDEEQIRRALKAILTARNYQTKFAINGQEALDIAIDYCPDIVMLDIAMPKMSGIIACKELRGWYEGPILILSVKSNENDIVSALDAGADDYLTKPFTAGELMARVRALLRRSAGKTNLNTEIKIMDLEINLAKRTVKRNGQEIDLTRLEFDILAYLAINRDCVVTSKMILQEVWGPEYGDDNQTLRVHVSHLRKKIEPNSQVPQYILTEPGVGFRLATTF